MNKIIEPVNLCFVTDDCYAMPTCVAMTSAIMNKNPGTFYNIYVLCNGVSLEKKQKILELKNPEVAIKIIDVDNKEDYSGFKIEGITATPTSIYKFYIPTILKNVDKIIFIDCDTIIQGGLSDLYNINLGDNLVGSVKNPSRLMRQKPELSKRCKYFNSGVMLMNLNAMREYDCPEKMMEYRRTGFNRLMDQDAINATVKSRVKMLPFKYNTMVGVVTANLFWSNGESLENIKEAWGINKKFSVEDIISNAVILHYYAAAKPWKYYDSYGNDIWYRYYILSPYGNIPLIRKSHYLEKTAKSKSYMVGEAVVKVLKKMKVEKKTREDKQYEKFLESFCEDVKF
ncbi:glycosyltransferase family 8 protein [Candidatus Saccharibacteria bacterium]|nr:glycosyltransferase family 8 protein [Candidatus Saccharibacteria bacterium]